jgi:iron complex outermembrane receptor protein
MRTILLLSAAILAALPASLAAQRTGVIAGVVVDESGRPIPDVQIVASADSARAISDSLGRFEIRNLEAGQYNLRARRIGFMPARTTADIGRGGRADLHIELKERPAILDSIVVTADGKCADRSFTGFLCRRRGGKGVYLTDDDIFDKNARELGDVFRGVPGFRVELRPSIWGPMPTPLSTKGSRCLNALVNGRLPGPTNQLPNFADQMVGVEIYASPSEVPAEYQQYAWGRAGRQSSMYDARGGSASEHCALVVYWTRLT